ncbi:MAG TPA: ABC transporter ATP-binding protein [Myxococcota bacterium]|nr:ABC transporter ATP-binding protein [Myxococcota bacterium]HQK51345.1 ABC transporter ATP-binding protein [Myxococcota bacterium]
MAEGPILRTEGVRKSYGTRVVTEVLHGIDLEVRPGEFVALTGPSGAGKTTLLNLIGLLDRPTSGRILLDGTDTSTLDDRGLTAFRGHKIGFVFQFHHLLPAFTALENVMMPLLVSRRYRDAEMERRARDLLERVGLGNRLKAKPSELSGGQQQRVAVARALVTRPPLVLTDEPTGNLDTHSAGEVFALLRECNREFRSAFVVVTHDPRLAARCDRVVEIVDGRIRTEPGAGGDSRSGPWQWPPLAGPRPT